MESVSNDNVEVPDDADALEMFGVVTNTREGVPVYMTRGSERFVAGVATLAKDETKGNTITIQVFDEAQDFYDALLFPGFISGIRIAATIDPKTVEQFH